MTKARKPRQYRATATRGSHRTPAESALACLDNASRVADMLATLPGLDAYCPHPAVTLAAEIRQAREYMRLAVSMPA